jgi:hypothetical protein
MVESEEQVNIGLEHKAFNKDGYIRADQLTHRLCAPKDSNEMKSFILWTKDSPTDNEPSWNKVVCIEFLLIQSKLYINNSIVWRDCSWVAQIRS